MANRLSITPQRTSIMLGITYMAVWVGVCTVEPDTWVECQGTGTEGQRNSGNT
jgi:hypothetical protein